MPDSDLGKRRSPRHAIVGIAEIVSDDGLGSIVCNVYDVNEFGARIGVPADYAFPKGFRLKRIATSEERKARLVWYKYGVAGVEFIDAT